MDDTNQHQFAAWSEEIERQLQRRFGKARPVQRDHESRCQRVESRLNRLAWTGVHEEYGYAAVGEDGFGHTAVQQVRQTGAAVRRHDDAVCVQLPHVIEDLQGGSAERNDDRLQPEREPSSYRQSRAGTARHRRPPEFRFRPESDTVDDHRRLRDGILHKRDTTLPGRASWSAYGSARAAESDPSSGTRRLRNMAGSLSPFTRACGCVARHATPPGVVLGTTRKGGAGFLAAQRGPFPDF